MRTRSLFAGAATVAALAVGVPLTMVATAPPAFACSCVQFELTEMMDRSDVVFAGTVTDQGATRSSGPAGTVSSVDPVEWTFQVDAVHKGDAEPVQMVLSAESSASCGFEFGVGRTYLVFGRFAGDEIETGLCDGTAELSDVSADVVESLGPGVVPAAAERPAVEGSGTPSTSGGAAAGAGGSDGEDVRSQPVADTADSRGPLVTVLLVAAVLVVAAAVVVTTLVRRRRSSG